MAEWTGHSRLSFPDKPVISRSQGCKDMIIGVAVWLPEKQQQKTQSGCSCFLSTFSLQQLWERPRQTGDGWPCRGCSPVSCLWSRVMGRVWDLGSCAAPSALEEVVTLYLKKSCKAASPGQPEPVEIHRDISSVTTDWGKGCWDQGWRNSCTHQHCHIFSLPWKAVRGSVVCLDYLPWWQEISLSSKTLMPLQRARLHLRETGCWQASIWIIKPIFKIMIKVFFSRNLNTMREINNVERDALPSSHLLTWT